jgi:hypothetical protein
MPIGSHSSRNALSVLLRSPMQPPMLAPCS